MLILLLTVVTSPLLALLTLLPILLLELFSATSLLDEAAVDSLSVFLFILATSAISFEAELPRLPLLLVIELLIIATELPLLLVAEPDTEEELE